MNVSKYTGLRFLSCSLLAFLLPSCQQPPTVYDTIDGGQVIYPAVFGGKPTVLAFLSANDRRCDKIIPSLWALSKRPKHLVKIVGVMVYGDFSFVRQIETLSHASFPILLDPNHELSNKHGVEVYPTFVYLSWEAKEIDRSENIAEVPQWIDNPKWYKKAMPEKKSQKPAEGKPPEPPPWQ